MIRIVVVRIIFLVVCCFFAAVIESESVLAKEYMGDGYYVISDFEIIEDVMGTYSFDEISGESYASRYKPYPEQTLSLGITQSVYWVRFKLLSPNAGDMMAGQLLQLNNPNIDKINIYIPISSRDSNFENHYIVKEVGVSRARSNCDIMDNTWVFQLTNQFDKQKFVYLRLESTSALRLSIQVWKADDFISEMLLKNLGFGAFYGILLAMLIFNLFIFSVLRDKAYLFYVLYIGFMFLYQFQVHGHLRMLIDIPYQIYNAIFWAWLAGAFVCSIYFTRNFLQIENTLPRLDKVLSGLVIGAILQGILGVLGYNIVANQIAHALGILGPVFIIIVAAIRFSQGFRAARYYMIAWGVLAIGIIIWSLAAYLPGIFVAVNYLLLATASESILLSLALADRMKTLRIKGEVLNKRVKWYRDLSLTDGMTGLFNKRFFDMKINEEMKVALQCERPLSIMVLDIDNFKSYNDTYGHWEGDQVIIRLGEILLNVVEEEQMAFRYGGEEFVLLMPSIICEDAALIGEKIRQSFMKEEFFPADKFAVTVTVSIGVTQMRLDDHKESFFQRADKALYTSKKNGRNRLTRL